MIASRRCLLVMIAALFSLGLATSAQAQQSSQYEQHSYRRPASHQAAPSLLSKEVLLAPMYKLHDGTKKLYASTVAFNTKVYRGTKRCLVKTASYLSPSNLWPSKQPPSRYGQARWASGRKKKPGAVDWLIPSWLKPEPSRPSKTMRDFLSQPRPDF